MSVERTSTCVPSIAPTHIAHGCFRNVQNHAQYRGLPVCQEDRCTVASINADNVMTMHPWAGDTALSFMLCCWLPSWRRTSTTRACLRRCAVLCTPSASRFLTKKWPGVSSVYRNVVYFIPQFICHLGVIATPRIHDPDAVCHHSIRITKLGTGARQFIEAHA